MSDFVAYTSRWRVALIIIGAAAFVAAGLWMAGAFGSPPTSHRYSPTMVFAIGWACVLFFGFCGLVSVTKLFGSSEQLRVDAEGIFYPAWSNKTIPWREIVDVTTWNFRKQNMIILHLRDPACVPRRGGVTFAQGANKMMTGGDVSISLIGTDRNFAEALAAIARFRG